MVVVVARHDVENHATEQFVAILKRAVEAIEDGKEGGIGKIVLVGVIDVGESACGGHVEFAQYPFFVDVAVEAFGQKVVVVPLFQESAFAHADAGASGHEVVGVFLARLIGIEEGILFPLIEPIEFDDPIGKALPSIDLPRAVDARSFIIGDDGFRFGPAGGGADLDEVAQPSNLWFYFGFAASFEYVFCRIRDILDANLTSI